jgi:putative addiction module component (TIGR02574 family)
LELSPEERAEFVEELLLSFDRASRERVDERWAREAEDRLDAFDRGELREISAEEFFWNAEGRNG